MKSKEWSDLIFKNTNDLVFLVAIESDAVYRCISVNPAYLKQTGLTEEQVIGKTPEEILPPEAAAFAIAKYKQAIESKEKLQYEEHVNLAIGSITLETTLQAIFDSEGNPTHLFGVLRDISERKRNENSLRESEKTLNDIFNHSPVPMLITEIEDGTITMVNESFANAVGHSVNDLIGKKSTELYNNPERRGWIRSQVLENGKMSDLEISLKGSNGQVRVYMFSSEVIELKGKRRFLSCFLDITERKAIQDALTKSENNLRTVFNTTETGYVLLDLHHDVASFNEQAYNFVLKEYGVHLKNGIHFHDHVPASNSQFLRKKIEDVFKGEFFESEIEKPKPDNTSHWYKLSYSPVFTDEMKVIAILLSIEDITEWKRNETERNTSYELISKQNKRLLDFSYIVSHNLRSHTSNIKAILGFIFTTESESDRKLLLEHLCNVANSLDETLFNLNEVVSVQANVNILTEQLNLQTYVNATCEVLGDIISEKKAMIYNKINENVTVKYNPAYLESILLNFVSNAVRYSHPERRPEVTIEYEMQNVEGILTISDNGLGIDLKKHGAKLFGMYKTFHGHKDAKGIGLFMTKNQIEAMGGRVEVDSTPGIGTTFTIYLNKQ